SGASGSIEKQGDSDGAGDRVTVTKEKWPDAHGRDAHATLGFDYIRRRLGIENAQVLQLGSPFDFARQATLYIEHDLPDPNDPLFLSAACPRIVHYLKQTHGGAFVLFTSYGMLNAAYRQLQGELEGLGLPALVQGQGQPPRLL